MKKVCVDTNILIWYIKRQCTVGQEECLDKAEYLFKYFEDENISIVVPSLVLAELLCNVEDEDERESYFDFISSNFEIAQHDILSARKFIELRLALSKTNAKHYASGKGLPKCQINNDYNICSVAISSGCDTIFSHNLKDFEPFVNHQIPVLTLDYVDTLKKQIEADKYIIPLKIIPNQVNITFDDEDDDEQ